MTKAAGPWILTATCFGYPVTKKLLESTSTCKLILTVAVFSATATLLELVALRVLPILGAETLT